NQGNSVAGVGERRCCQRSRIPAARSKLAFGWCFRGRVGICRFDPARSTLALGSNDVSDSIVPSSWTGARLACTSMALLPGLIDRLLRGPRRNVSIGPGYRRTCNCLSLGQAPVEIRRLVRYPTRLCLLCHSL